MGEREHPGRVVYGLRYTTVLPQVKVFRLHRFEFVHSWDWTWTCRNATIEVVGEGTAPSLETDYFLFELIISTPFSAGIGKNH